MEVERVDGRLSKRAFGYIGREKEMRDGVTNV